MLTLGHCLPVAGFLFQLALVKRYVAVCVRVFRSCHQRSGGTDVPDVLLPEGQYLDMFDSESDLSGDLSFDELIEVP